MFNFTLRHFISKLFLFQIAIKMKIPFTFHAIPVASNKEKIYNATFMYRLSREREHWPHQHLMVSMSTFRNRPNQPFE